MNIRPLKKEELVLLFHYAQMQDWDIEEVHIRALFHAYPDDFFVAHLENELLGFIVALKYSKEFGFISTFIVLKKFRSLGYGTKIFNFALTHLKDCQIALDCPKDKISFYEKFGFKSYFDVKIFQYITDNSTSKIQSSKVCKLDTTLSLVQNDKYLKNILLDEKVDSYAIMKDKEISSYAFSFAYKGGYKITIKSENIDEATELFFAFIKNYVSDTVIYMQVTKLSLILEELVKFLKMKLILKEVRMYNKVLE